MKHQLALLATLAATTMALGPKALPGCLKQGLKLCGRQCVDVLTDVNHCGRCPTKCIADQTCVGGICTCENGGTKCDAQCVNTQTDRTNCGFCGNACNDDEKCDDSQCVPLVPLGPTCNQDEEVCGSTCCSAGQSCDNDICKTPPRQCVVQNAIIPMRGGCFNIRCTIHIMGATIEANSAVDIYDCATQCGGNSDCEVVDFDTGTGICTLLAVDNGGYYSPSHNLARFTTDCEPHDDEDDP